jgi:hypothetical protein
LVDAAHEEMVKLRSTLPAAAAGQDDSSSSAAEQQQQQQHEDDDEEWSTVTKSSKKNKAAVTRGREDLGGEGVTVYRIQPFLYRSVLCSEAATLLLWLAAITAANGAMCHPAACRRSWAAHSHALSACVSFQSPTNTGVTWYLRIQAGTRKP